MNVPLSWLHDYVDVTLPVTELAERLTLAGLEVSGIRPVGVPVPEGVRVKSDVAGPIWDRDRVVVAQVVEVLKHPNADKLKLPIVDLGGGKTKQLVTGATNINLGDKGQKVVVGLMGTTYFDGHNMEKTGKKELRQLKPAQVRGVPSDAMVMSQFELGIADDHEGVIILDEDAPVGTPFADYMGDIVLEIDVLPNMARCLSMIGIAREVAALTGQKLRLLPQTAECAGESIEGQVKVVIEDPNLSARYAAMLMKNVKVGPAPYWMRRRLTLAGMRPISNLVDVTNYVMLEWGQPLHAFDHDKLIQRAGGNAPTIFVRPARPGEKLTTLDKNERALSADNLVIADEKGPIALAGVMGGLETEVTDNTTSVLLESASFHFVSIRRTYREFDLPSEASARFSRGVHPEMVKPAAQRASELMRQHGGAVVCKGMVDVYPAPLKPQVIDLKLSEVRRQLGLEVSREEATRVLSALEFKVEDAGAGSLRVTTPPHRLDIQEGPADLIEELARIHGYDRLPARLLAEPLPEQLGNSALELEEKVRDLLVNAGLQEVITYALTVPEREAPLGAAQADYVRLQNPISSERTVMRHSLLASAIEVAALNLKHRDGARLFEVGSIYLPHEGEPLPSEEPRLAIVLTGHRDPEFWADAKEKHEPLDFFDLKGTIEALTEGLHLNGISYKRAHPTFLHPGRAAEILLNGERIGVLGQLHPRTAAEYAKLLDSPGLAGGDILVADLDLAALLKAVPPRHLCAPVPSFPAALRDIAVIVDESVTSEQVLKEICAAGGELLCHARLFDLYRGESIAAGMKSLAYALTYQAPDRTLTDKEIDKVHKQIENRLKHVLKASIRGQE
jgi:phenylalanyl-tRNA synthetase beta chain